ncbi:hypothetical protein BU16DRAFT_582128 [Lophium mytilinum]|uniref:Uncharacterized protein n=1 Tax=Lophium mytilinum TaxID=390894 RepID=A0A6A6QU16_9PEZI|nr:hypothetical protein BU16DRAFT_582128 [Lophium mytilinum]
MDARLDLTTCVPALASRPNLTEEYLEFEAKNLAQFNDFLTSNSAVKDYLDSSAAFKILEIIQDEHVYDDRQVRLSASSSAFRHILQYFDAPTGFITAICKHWQTSGTGFRSLDMTGSFDHWCLVPVRVRTKCVKSDGNEAHRGSHAAAHQMNPFYYIHLAEDCRWKDLINAPFASIQDSLRISTAQSDPLCAHLAYLNNSITWWNDVLDTFNRELIAEEPSLQDGLETSAALAPVTSSAAINKKLHTMAAHLYRYGSELDRVDKIALELKTLHAKLRPVIDPDHFNTVDELVEWQRIDQGFDQIISQMTALRGFREELKRKTSNILALLFNNMQLLNDDRMQEILRATQEDTRRSQDLAISMKEDSIAMKTRRKTIGYLPHSLT